MAVPFFARKTDPFYGTPRASSPTAVKQHTAKQFLTTLAFSFGEGGSASNCEPRRKGTINYYYILICFFIPYRQNLAYALFCHFPRRRKRTTVIIISVYSFFLPLSSLRDIFPVSSGKSTPKGKARKIAKQDCVENKSRRIERKQDK